MDFINNIFIDKDNNVKNLFFTPQIIDSDNDYYSKLEGFFDSLTDSLKAFPEYSHILNETIIFKEAILSAFIDYVSGRIGIAQNRINNIIKDLIDSKTVVAVSNINNSISFHDKSILFENQTLIENSPIDYQVDFYRARKSEHFCIYKREEMLHIPFNKRYTIPTNRFSIPGLPCLYLANTSYCCWIEMRNPPDHCFNVSAVQLDNTQKILNLTLNISDLIKLGNNISYDQFVVAYKIWLLAYASSYKVKQKDRTFKSEYIIPQLIMLSCLSLNLDGVAYYSKQVDNDANFGNLCVNLALFAKYNKEEKYSSICNHIKLSPSFNFSMFKNIKESHRLNDYNLCIDKKLFNNYISFNGYYVEYNHTDFYDFDKFIFSEYFDAIQTPLI